MSEKGSERPGRPPSGDGRNRDRILAAARHEFAAKGFRGATMRSIAAAAGVDVALLAHYFGNKDGLFAATLQLPGQAVQQVQGAFDGPVGELGERLARAYLSLWEDPGLAGSLRATVASALAHEGAREQLRELLTAALPEDVHSLLPGDDPDLRLGLALNHLFGIALGRHLLRLPPLADRDLPTLLAAIAPTVQHYLTGPLGRSVEPATT
ncbi:TetR/AcrR family transcriptional regulator [Spongiactinospora rosea]|uniref:TetR/AcrR family transcriptional regulator n=1 Tax=Spongiactinospora rosea TaxID=2248750 RepID=A0A366M7Y8_9ACTN|nr:TetR family transcriptional regulator [Spongiactinospora rosea]RBQ21714.1 TetR/AcrR family transcriptional regulator [Spongiactinospora rosea]